MNLLDALLGALNVQGNGTPLKKRGAVNFIGSTVEDDPDHDRINVTSAPPPDGDAVVSLTSVIFTMTKPLAYTQFNGLGAIGSDFVNGAVGKLAPITILHIDLSTSYHPTIGLGASGVLPGWVVHMVLTGDSDTTLSVLNGTSGSQPLVDLANTDYEKAAGGGYDARKKIQSFMFMGAGDGATQINGHLWQRLSVFGTPALP
jgi:hypothetical protein